MEIKSLRNPVSQAFGVFLKKVRERRSWSYEDIKAITGISPTYFRSIETGQFHLHVSRAAELYALLKPGLIDHYYQLDGLIQLLSLISSMESRGNEFIKDRKKKAMTIEERNAAYSDGLIVCATELSELSDRMKYFFKHFLNAGVFSLLSVDEVAQEIEKLGLDVEISNFLSQYNTYGLPNNEKLKSYGEKLVHDIPTLYLDFMIETKKNLTGLPLRIFFEDLGKWEEDRSPQHKKSYVLITGSFDYAHEKNLEKFLHPYLFQKEFQGAYIIIEDKTRDSAEEKERFIKNLAKAYGQKSKPHTWEQGVARLHFRVLPSLTKDLKQILTIAGEKTYQAFWMFQSHDDTLVGFLANSHFSDDEKRHVFDTGRNLFLQEVSDRLDIISAFWEDEW